MSGAAQSAGRPGAVLVLGLGNPDRGDDGAGAAAAQALIGRVPPEVVVQVRRGDLLALIEDWEGFEALVCIDAAAPMGLPGRIHRVDVDATPLPASSGVTSSHAFGLPEAIELARSLELLPRRIIVYAIEGESFESGAPLTPAVAEGALRAADQVLAEVDRLQGITAEEGSHA